jgi:hypothetical protein
MEAAASAAVETAASPTMKTASASAALRKCGDRRASKQNSNG